MTNCSKQHYLQHLEAKMPQSRYKWGIKKQTANKEAYTVVFRAGNA